jgi:DNA-binding XRE family transcriptional regulator
VLTVGYGIDNIKVSPKGNARREGSTNLTELNIDAIKALQKKYEMSEAELARKAGVSRSCVNRILKGTRKPSFKFISGLKQAFPQYPMENFFQPQVVPKGDTHKTGTEGGS